MSFRARCPVAEFNLLDYLFNNGSLSCHKFGKCQILIVKGRRGFPLNKSFALQPAQLPVTSSRVKTFYQ